MNQCLFQKRREELILKQTAETKLNSGNGFESSDGKPQDSQSNLESEIGEDLMNNKTQIENLMSPCELIPQMILESPSKSHQYEDVLSPTKSEQDSLTESFSGSNLDSPIQSVPGFDIDNKPPPGSGSLPRKSTAPISSNSRSLINDSFTSVSKENAVEIPDELNCEPKVSVLDEIMSVNEDVCKSCCIDSIENIASSGTNNSMKEEGKDEQTCNYSINAQTVIHSEISECTENQAQDDPSFYNQEYSSRLESVHKPLKGTLDEIVQPLDEKIVALDAENCSERKEIEIMSEENLKTDKYQKSEKELDDPAEEPFKPAGTDKGPPQQPESFHTEEIEPIQAEDKDLLKNVPVELDKGEVNLETGASLVKPPAGFGDSPEKSRTTVKQSKLEKETEHVLTLSQVSTYQY